MLSAAWRRVRKRLAWLAPRCWKPAKVGQTGGQIASQAADLAQATPDALRQDGKQAQELTDGSIHTRP